MINYFYYAQKINQITHSNAFKTCHPIISCKLDPLRNFRILSILKNATVGFKFLKSILVFFYLIIRIFLNILDVETEFSIKSSLPSLHTPEVFSFDFS